jgi:hypothetical protein
LYNNSATRVLRTVRSAQFTHNGVSSEGGRRPGEEEMTVSSFEFMTSPSVPLAQSQNWVVQFHLFVGLSRVLRFVSCSMEGPIGRPAIQCQTTTRRLQVNEPRRNQRTCSFEPLFIYSLAKVRLCRSGTLRGQVYAKFLCHRNPESGHLRG